MASVIKVSVLISVSVAVIGWVTKWFVQESDACGWRINCVFWIALNPHVRYAVIQVSKKPRVSKIMLNNLIGLVDWQECLSVKVFMLFISKAASQLIMHSYKKYAGFALKIFGLRYDTRNSSLGSKMVKNKFMFTYLFRQEIHNTS